jgi:O-antigen ligase
MQFFGLNLPVDFTIITGALLLGFTAYKLIRKNNFSTNNISFFGIGLLLLFYAWMIFSLFYTHSEQYSREKTFYFLLNITAFTVPFFFDQFNIRRFIIVFAAGTIILAIGLLPFQYFYLLGDATKLGPEGAYSAIGGLYLTLSEYLGLILVLVLTKKKDVFISKAYDLVIATISLGLMVLLGARGPLIFALLVYSIYHLSSIHVIRFTIRKRTLWIMGLGGFLLIISIFLIAQLGVAQKLFANTLFRFTSLINDIIYGGGQDQSADTRVLLIQDAFWGIVKSIDSFLFGYGIGSFGIITWGEDIRLYPHNMILEIWFELGLIGLMAFFIWIVYVLTKLRGQPNQYISYWLIFYVFLNLMKSSSLVDIRTEFAFFALFAVQNFLLVKEPNPALA